jgi:hypothetical protein
MTGAYSNILHKGPWRSSFVTGSAILDLDISPIFVLRLCSMILVWSDLPDAPILYISSAFEWILYMQFFGPVSNLYVLVAQCAWNERIQGSPQPPICLAICPHDSTREQVDWFWWNLVLMLCNWRLPYTHTFDFPTISSGRQTNLWGGSDISAT